MSCRVVSCRVVSCRVVSCIVLLNGPPARLRVPKVRKHAGVNQPHFVTEKRYSETVVPQLLRAAVVVLDVPLGEIMGFVGSSFVGYVSRYGYERILRVLGRHVRDFLNGLDNLHEYLRFTYPSMKPPSFYCEDETATGLKLHYRSRRKGFLHYVIGQIRAVGQVSYILEMARLVDFVVSFTVPAMAEVRHYMKQLLYKVDPNRNNVQEA